MDWRLPWGLSLTPNVCGIGPDLSVRAPSGRVLCALGWLVTLYIRQGDRPAVREGMVHAYERARSLMGRDFAWGADPDSGEPLALSSSSVGDVRNWPPSVFQLFDFQMMFVGGSDVDDADGFSFVAVSREEQAEQLSYLSVTLPLAWANTQREDDFVRWVDELCTLVGPSHGYAGPAIVAHPAGIDDDAARAIFGLGERYRGLEIDMPAHHEPYLSRESAIKGVNWLTILSSDYEARLGGRAHLADALGAHAELHSWTSPATSAQGVILRAVDGPRLGEMAIRESMAGYEHIAKTLRPLRTINPAVIWPQDLAGFDFDQSKAWMTRFD
jgi:hypothetical protein